MEVRPLLSPIKRQPTLFNFHSFLTVVVLLDRGPGPGNRQADLDLDPLVLRTVLSSNMGRNFLSFRPRD
ncbi:hypothetical protein MUK42_32875 [Musa troglodytarum]|uniref:Uncharacterized protein n=1 Tax=Musa troglodytarum TaxID=320322 RepID=A0A9E7FDC9_9LILI|nr:hypothetical protein MUK42_32875 [Musa troglodytarum]